MVDWLHRTRRSKLPNGLTVLTHSLPHSEVAALHFCVQAGYFCEKDSEVGLAHLLEHMYFKGSQRYPVPEGMGVRLKALGGSLNATTSYDQTCYFCEVPAEGLLPALDILSDAFVAPLFPADELQRETEVVIEEFNRKIDSPGAYSMELLIQMAYTEHRMKRWRIGTPEQLRAYRNTDLFDYFYRYYQPQNMIVTVTGRFDEETIVERIAQSLAGMKNADLRKDFGPVEPPQNRLRYALRRATATQSFLHMGFHVPGVTHEDQPALEFLCSLLSGGKSGRLHRYVVEQRRSASSVSAGVMAYEDIGLMLFSSVTEAGKIRKAGRDIWDVIQDLLRNGISESELLKVKNKLKLTELMQTEDALNLAELLSYNEAYGGYLKIEEHLRAMGRLTEGEILSVAAKYLMPANLSVLEFMNEDVDPLNIEGYERHLQESFVAPEISLPPPIVLASSSLPGAHSEPARPLLRQGRVTYLLQPDPELPFVAAGIFFRGGRNEETQRNAGLTHFLMRLALKGTTKLNAEQIAFRFDALGNPPRFSSNRDTSGFLMEALPESFPEMWDLLLHCLSDASFPDKEIETERGKVISTIRRNMDDNFVRPLQLFQRAYYGTHPYGLPEAGFEETVSGFGMTDLAQWKRRLFHGGRILVAAVGDFDTDDLMQRFEESLSALPASGLEFIPPEKADRPAQRELVENRVKKQTAFVLGFPAVSATNPDVYKYEVLQQILSGMGGRLFINLRSKKSLAYTVYAGTASSLYSGTFLTYLAGEASKEAPALEGMWQELEALKKEHVAPEEIANARAALIGNYTLNTQAASARLVDFANSYLLGRPIPFAPEYRKVIEKVTAEDIMEIANKAFVREHSAMGIIKGTTEKTDAEKLVLA
ncbi:MAG TPA: pitrilysin family protein [Acidobacteriota bacterium]|nr:pitrilysin family protein [Acidobacteriota bacterium]